MGKESKKSREDQGISRMDGGSKTEGQKGKEGGGSVRRREGERGGGGNKAYNVRTWQESGSPSYANGEGTMLEQRQLKSILSFCASGIIK